MEYMEQAISLARLALGQSSPNPAVGAVVVKDNEVVGQGYTQPAGSHHAEIMALNQAGELAKGGALYVTLEPCCHYGRTPPCTQAIIAAGITEVHMSMLDANPIVHGRGKAELEKEGIRVYTGAQEEAAQEINEAYSRFITTGLPFVTVKYAMSLDGKIATKDGDSRWISGEAARKYVHYMRYVADAIMVGVNTVLADDPQLTSRCCGGRGGTAKKQPLRVIVDSFGRTPTSAKLFSEPGETLLALGSRAATPQVDAFVKTGAKLLELPGENEMVDLAELLRVLGERQVTSVLVEGGGALLGSLFDRGLVDKVVAFIAPVIIGGAEAKTAVAGKGAGKIADAIRLKRVRTERLGEDMMVTGYVRE